MDDDAIPGPTSQSLVYSLVGLHLLYATLTIMHWPDLLARSRNTSVTQQLYYTIQTDYTYNHTPISGRLSPHANRMGKAGTWWR